METGSATNAVERLTENITATTEAATAATEQLTEALGPLERLPHPRTERRAQERAYLANGYRANKASIRRTTANERGTLPGARELAKIHTTRKDILARLRKTADEQFGEGVVPDGALELDAEILDLEADSGAAA